MRIEKIKAAQDEARRFLKVAYDLLSMPDVKNQLYGSKATGAVRRASLDLTRTLAEMRKP